MPGPQRYRTRLGAKFSEGARLLWQLGLDHKRIRADLGIGVGVSHRWLYGDTMPSTRWAVALLRQYGVPLEAWGMEPTEPFILKPAA